MSPKPRHRPLSGRNALVLLAASCLLLSGCGVVAATPTTSMPTIDGEAARGSAPTMSMTEAVPEEKSAPGRIPVYWLGLNGSDVLLYREFLTAQKSGDPISEAVRAMTAGNPLDPDYFTPWREAGSVTASISGKNVITVDISADAFKTPLDAGMAHRAIQQLVHTATAAAFNAGLTTVGHPSSVVLLVDGKADYQAFGQVRLDAELHRDPALVAPIWIIDPQEGFRTQGSLTVSGAALSEGGQLSWKVAPIVDGRPAEEAVESGFADLQTPTGGISPFSFTVELAPGEYSVSVFHGADRADEDSKRVSVDSEIK